MAENPGEAAAPESAQQVKGIWETATEMATVAWKIITKHPTVCGAIGYVYLTSGGNDV